MSASEVEGGDLAQRLGEAVDRGLEQRSPRSAVAMVGSPMWPSGPKSFDSQPKPTLPPKRT